MTTVSLALSYIKKAMDRLDVLDLLFKKSDYSDVVREAQEIVELSVKGILRFTGIEPPKYHDVSSMLIEHKDKFKDISNDDINKIVKISKTLRKERELSFYGDIDFIPTEEYTSDNAKEAIDGANFVVTIVKRFVENAGYKSQPR